MSESEPPIKEYSAINEVQRRILGDRRLCSVGRFAVSTVVFFSGGSFGGYHFILSPPRASDHINSSLLFLELAGLALIAWFLFVAARNVRAKRIGKTAMVLIIALAIPAVFLFGWFVWPKSYTEAFSLNHKVYRHSVLVVAEKSLITEAEKNADDVAAAKPVLTI